VLVTGATGFVGTAVCSTLAAAGYEVRRALRSAGAAAAHDTVVGEIHASTDWTAALSGVDTVVHLAARTHVLRETAADPETAYRRVNVDGTRRLAEQSAEAGVRRLIFVSSIKVNGEATEGAPFRESDPPRPQDAYGRTKLEAEQALSRIAERRQLDFAILRPPLVYGPGVKGNFLRLLQLVAREVPLPLRSIDNRRSLIYVGNLADAITSCAGCKRRLERTWLVRDDQDLSTPALLSALADAMGRRVRLVPFPVPLLRIAGSLSGRAGEVARLTGSLQIDDSRIRTDLGWAPRRAAREGLAETARWYDRQHGARASGR
jgi:nucleoside-diphosphate-sugar epimerase